MLDDSCVELGYALVSTAILLDCVTFSNTNESCSQRNDTSIVWGGRTNYNSTIQNAWAKRQQGPRNQD